MTKRAIASKLQGLLPQQAHPKKLPQLWYDGIAVFFVVLGVGVMTFLHPLLYETPASLFYVVVMLSSWLGGFRSGLLATILSVIALNYLVLEPQHAFEIVRLKTVFQLGVFAMAGGFISYLNQTRLSAQRRADANFKSWRDSQAQFTHLTEANIIGIFAADLNGLITEANDAFFQMIGYTREDMLAGRVRWQDMTPPEYQEVSEKSHSELLTMGFCKPFEKEYIRKDGSRVPVFLGSVMQGQHRMFGFVLDRSDAKRYEAERQRAEYALRDSEERYRYLANSIPQLVWIAAPDGTMLDVNERWSAYTGLTLEEVQAQGWEVIVHPDDISGLTDNWLAAVAAGTSYQAEGRQRRADGVYRWHLHQAIPQKDKHERIVKWYGTATDIHDRKQTQLNEQFLSTLDLQLRQLLDAEEMMQQTVTRLGQYLEVTRCTLGEINLQQGTITIGHDWCPDLPSVVGTYGLSDYITPEFQTTLAAGRSAIVNDVATDPRTAAYAKNHESNQVLAFASIPCIDQGRWVASLTIYSSLPRIWRDDEVILLQDAVTHLWPLIEQTRATQALRESEARFRQMADTAPVLIWMAGIDKLCDYFNQAWLDFTGRMIAQELGDGWAQGVHPDDLQYCLDTYIQSFDARQEFKMEYRLRRSDGEYRWLLDHGVPRLTPSGEFLGYIGSCVDIQDRKQAEIEREQRLIRERYYIHQLQGLTAAALEINAAPLLQQMLQVTTDQAAAIVEAHQAVTLLAIDQNWAQATSAFYLSDKYAQWRDYSEPPTGSGIYSCVCHTNRPIRMTQAQLEAHPQWRGFGKEAGKHPPMRGWLAAPLIGRDGTNIGLIQLSDKFEGEFTEADEAILVQLAQIASVVIEKARLYEAEQQARTAAETSREAAEAANRIKDEFLAVLSHELRSPLNPILGWTKLLQSRQFTPEKTAQALATIERNAKLQAQLIEDLLDVSRILRGKMMLNICSVDLVSTIEAAIKTVRLAAEAKNIQIRTQFTTHAVTVAGDSGRLQQVIWNLLTNAVKFTPNGGWVEVRLEPVERGSGEERGSGRVKANSPPIPSYAQITVSDTGKGISPEFLPYVFDYFRQEDGTTTRKFGGLGLGLAIVQHLTEQHGGTVRVESEGEGKGATFAVELPLQPLPIIQEAQSSPAQLVNLSQRRILVVDDESDMRELVLTILESYGATVKTAASAEQALVILQQWQPDLLISDIGMPDMDGYMLMRRVRSLPLDQGGQIPAIALTAYAGEIDQQQAVAVGFQRHLTKPIEPEQVMTAIVQVLKVEQGGENCDE